jgi:hypothetical protein
MAGWGFGADDAATEQTTRLLIDFLLCLLIKEEWHTAAVYR